MKVWNENTKGRGSALDKVNLKRLYFMLECNKYTPLALKLTRRSRRRWRGRYGGLYTYPENMLDLFNKAKKEFEEKHG